MNKTNKLPKKSARTKGPKFPIGSTRTKRPAKGGTVETIPNKVKK